MVGAPFYMVWRENGGAPTKTHSTSAAAEFEASRLAREMPGTSFYVLAATAMVRKVDVEVRRFDDDRVPF